MFEAIHKVIRRIPRGKVATYGAVAKAAGYPGASRQVVWALRAAKAPLPWHRVLGAGGKILLPGQNGIEQRLRLETEGVKLTFSDDAIAGLARFAVMVNEQTENIGARRLHTILERVLDEISFEAPELKKKNVKIDAPYVAKQLAEIAKNQDLSRYIL